MTGEFSIRLAEPNDDTAILSLLRSAFAQMEFTESWWLWFSSGPTRSYVLTIEGAAIGLVSLIEYPSVQCDGEESRGALAANLCLAPAYQRKNRGGDRSFFRDLMREVIERERSRGTECLLVVPNANSVGRLRGDGWKEVATLATWEKSRDKSASHGRGLKPCQIDESLVTILNRKALPEEGAKVARTQPFLRWRHEQRPDASYEYARSDGADSAVVLKRFTDPKSGFHRFHIMDFGCENPEGFREALGFSEARAGEADVINFWLAEGSSLEGVAQEQGYRPISKRPLLAGPGWEERADARSRQFAFTFSDCDVY